MADIGRSALILILAGAVSCGEIPEEQAPAYTRGQAGMLHASPDPRVRLGTLSAPEPEQFVDVRGALQLSDGRILVAEASDQEIRVFSEDGAFLESWGRRGEGPGEFREIDGLFLLLGDTVGAFDLRSRRYSLFSPHGEFLGVSSRHPRISFSAGFVRGDLVAAYRDFPKGGQGIREAPPFSIDCVTFAGDTVARPGPFPGSRDFHVIRGTANYSTRLLLASRTHVAAGPLGIWVGHGSSSQISLFSAEGEKVHEVNLPFDRRRTTEADVQAFVDRHAPPGGKNPGWREVHLDMVETVAPPDSLPWFDEMLPELAGGIWVREYPSSGLDPWVWWRLEPGVNSVTRAQLPRSLRRVYQLTGDFVLGVEFGEFREPMVVLFDLLPDS